MKAKLKKLLSYSVKDWSLLVQAWSLLLAIDIGLRILPSEKSRMDKTTTSKEKSELEAERIIQRSSGFLDLAARHHLYPMTCLRRSLTLQWLLSRAGLYTTLQFGVRRENENLQAHAWLDYQGQVIDKNPIPQSNMPI